MESLRKCYRVISAYIATQHDNLHYRIELLCKHNILDNISKILNQSQLRRDDELIFSVSECIANIAAGDDSYVLKLMEIDNLLEHMLNLLNIDKPLVLENVKTYLFSKNGICLYIYYN